MHNCMLFRLTDVEVFGRMIFGINRLRQPRNPIDTRGSLRPSNRRTHHYTDSLKEDLALNTYMAKAADVQRKWYVVDAQDVVLGRLASQVAAILRGKNKPIYTPHVDTGDYVIVINADKVKLTGKKLDQKIYYHHSGWIGGMKETTLREMLQKKPEQVVELAVKGMLPKGPLGRQMYTKLHVYAGAEHPHAAQKPEVLTF